MIRLRSKRLNELVENESEGIQKGNRINETEPGTLKMSILNDRIFICK